MIWPRSFTKRENYCKIIRGIFLYVFLVCFGPGYFGLSEYGQTVNQDPANQGPFTQESENAALRNVAVR